VRGGDADEVTSALAAADQRLMSAKYLSAGMGDGGGCHPRDQIAMSWLANEADLSADIFGFLARARDAQTMRQAQLVASIAEEAGLPICVLGEAYKADVNLTIGSPSLLLIEFLKRFTEVEISTFDPWCSDSELPETPRVFFVGTKHAIFRTIKLPSGSVVIDPWGNAVPEQMGSRTLRPGRLD
jgi:UDPglucose 6-dehydrogenase